MGGTRNAARKSTASAKHAEDVWFHWECLNIDGPTPGDSEDPWLCPDCETYCLGTIDEKESAAGDQHRDEHLESTVTEPKVENQSAAQNQRKDTVGARHVGSGPRPTGVQDVHLLQSQKWLSHKIMDAMFKTVLPTTIRLYDAGNVGAKVTPVVHKGEQQYFCFFNTGNHWVGVLIDTTHGTYVIDPLHRDSHTAIAKAKAEDIIRAFPPGVLATEDITTVKLDKKQDDDYNCGIYVFVACLQLIGKNPESIKGMSVHAEYPDTWREVLSRFLSDPAGEHMQDWSPADPTTFKRLQTISESLADGIAFLGAVAYGLQQLASYVNRRTQRALKTEMVEELAPTTSHDQLQQLQKIIEMPQEVLIRFFSFALKHPTFAAVAQTTFRELQASRKSAGRKRTMDDQSGGPVKKRSNTSPGIRIWGDLRKALKDHATFESGRQPIIDFFRDLPEDPLDKFFHDSNLTRDIFDRKGTFQAMFTRRWEYADNIRQRTAAYAVRSIVLCLFFWQFVKGYLKRAAKPDARHRGNDLRFPQVLDDQYFDIYQSLGHGTSPRTDVDGQCHAPPTPVSPNSVGPHLSPEFKTWKKLLADRATAGFKLRKLRDPVGGYGVLALLAKDLGDPPGLKLSINGWNQRDGGLESDSCTAAIKDIRRHARLLKIVMDNDMNRKMQAVVEACMVDKSLLMKHFGNSTPASL
ncbi:hypothetical protein K491DRAFT_763638 [Lophiostoma macrostomum CBS 122681]|uniref:Uncharacterized protein n=1 Tax=Lophiostoma macrostomum CBS 122681 TaxID=1314788 RepID=A0A6A6SJF0_9PLEO|nr:hypothetical protein K491DRAFT_763638 [Lophiostoma macrostomum CBS 122681]